MRKIIVLALIIGLFACKEDDSSNIRIEGYRPVKIIKISDEDNDTIRFSYNGINPSIVETKTEIHHYEYQGEKLYKRKIFRKGDEIPWLYQEYNYDSQNRLIKVSYFINVNSTVEGWNGDPIEEYELSAHYGYEYNDGILTNEFYYDDRTNIRSSYTYIDYDENNNIIKKRQYREIEGESVIREIVNITYDSKQHYFRDINYPAFASIYSTKNNVLIEEEINYSAMWDINNGVTITDSTVNTYNFSYDYNLEGYPSKVVGQDETLYIEYEFFTTKINE